MKKVLLLIATLPVVILAATIYLIRQDHIKNPEKLSCNAFKSTLVSYMPLYVSEKDFRHATEEMCNCFIKQNPSKEALLFVTENSLKTCAKDNIQTWSVPQDKKITIEQERCIKNKSYNRISQLIIDRQRKAHSNGFLSFERKPFLGDKERKNRFHILEACLQGKPA